MGRLLFLIKGNIIVKMFEKLQISLEIVEGLWYTIMEYFYASVGRSLERPTASLLVVCSLSKGDIPALYRIKIAIEQEVDLWPKKRI